MNAVKVGFSFSLESCDASFAACGEVAEEDLPGHGADFGGETRPGGVSEFGE